jgi:uncharacterized protein
MMNSLVVQVKDHVYRIFKEEYSGHDHHHIDRVFRMATLLQQKEGGDLEVIQLTALLHDISDHKLNGGKLNDGGRVAKDLLVELEADPVLIDKVCSLIDKVSYKGALVKDEMFTLEGMIVQDADRLDAIGAIGIARAFAFGGSRNRVMYDPSEKPELHSDFQAYATSQGNTINHFHEKLLLLKDRLHTTTAKEIGAKRHQYMLNFLDHFQQEWTSEHYE